MDAPTISIKIRGLQALQALNGNGQLAGGIKIKGAGAMLRMGEMEGRRAIMTNNGLMMREMEDGGRRMMLQPSNGASAANGPTAAKGAVAKSANVTAMKGVAVKSAAGAPTGLGMASTKGVGWGLALGGLGPWLALAALGLAATGIYFYMRAQQLSRFSGDDLDDPDMNR